MNPKRKPLLTFLIVVGMALATLPCAGQSPPKLSESATASLLTLWPGNEIYLAFGHSAFRIRDPSRRIDLIFNYGTFDFSDPLFVPKFVKGYLNYYLAYYPFAQDFQFDKRTENRQWYEQVLNLDPSQVNALFDFLLDNARPEKKFYRYDFILDNCATRIRDAMLKVLGPDVQFDPGNICAPHKSFRRMIDEFVADRPFYHFMFYPVLGMASDKEVTSFESQFLPLYMMKVFDSSTILRNGKAEPLVRSESTLYSPLTPVSRGTRWADPSFLIWPCALLSIIFTIINFARLRKTGTLPARRTAFRALDALLFFMAGLIGCLVFYLTVFSVHAAAKANLSVFLLLPTNIVAAVFLLRKRPLPCALSWYFLGVAVFCLIPLLAWPVWPQPMHLTMAAFTLMIAVRALWFFFSARSAGKALHES